MATVASGPMKRAMMSDDVKKHLEALDVMGSYAVDNTLSAELSSNVDIVLHWISIRVNEGNTSIVLKSLDVLDGISKAMSEKASPIPEPEASLLIPTLISKLGAALERIRAAVRSTIR